MDTFADSSVESGMASGPLPQAQNRRWQPLRSGLMNMYRYENQEFHFHCGRLLLRGNNGTGKSRVLALQLPFLLDGETAAHRVEPDGDPAKRFEWNLLMGKYPDRLGYTWIEFGRRDDDGREHYTTLGCGVRAVSGKGIAGRWFFVTSQRIGRDLFLCTPLRSPLAKDALAEVLGADGQLFTTASDYRAAVNAKLFDLRQDRYDALVDLLIELRQPQLARNLDEARLSNALSNALPPVSRKIIEQVADAMRGLEEDRAALAQLALAKAAADAFLKDYRQYAAISARRRADEVRSAQSAYLDRQRKQRETEIAFKDAAEQEKTVLARQEALAIELAATLGQRQTLENSPEMRSAQDLNAAQTRSDERRREATGQAREHERAAAEHTAAAATVERAGARAALADKALADSAHATALTAEACGIVRAHHEHLTNGDVLRTNDTAALDRAREALDRLVKDRRQAARMLAELNAALANARRALETETAKRDKEDQRVAESMEAVSAAEDAVAAAIANLADAYRKWHGQAVVLAPAHPQDVVPEITVWCEESIGATSPVRAAVDQALGELHRNTAAARAGKRQELSAVEELLAALRAEKDRLSKGDHQPPPSPYTRDEKSRAARAGAPLWMLCDFADNVSEPDRAGIEAALEASGLLDAWVNPDGTMAGREDDLDTFLLDEDAGKMKQPTLAKLIRPAVDRAGRAADVPTELIDRVIGRIGLGEGAGAVWVNTAGHWRIGPKAGYWAKPAALHIGQAAREAARRKRLLALEEELAAARQTESAIREALAELDRQESLARAEAQRAPDDGSVRGAAADRDAQRKQLTQNRVRLLEAEKQVAVAAENAAAALAKRDTAAIDLDLSAWTDRLSALEDALGDYRQALAALWPAARERLLADQSWREEQARLAQARERADRVHAAARDAEQKAAAAEAELLALRQTVGVAVEEVLRRLRMAEMRLAAIQGEQRDADQSIGALRERVRLHGQAIQELAVDIEKDTEIRAKAIEHLLRFVGTGLLHLVVPDEPAVADGAAVEMSVTAAVELARKIDNVLAAIDHADAAWDKNQRLIHAHVQDLITALQSQDYRPETTTDGDVLVVTAHFHGRRQKIDGFSGLLAEEMVNRQALLTANERKLLENYLVHDVAVELGGLIRRAAELVRDMSKQLQLRPTSTGMMLQFKWEPLPDGPATFLEARKKLLGDSSTWSVKDRALLGDFLQERIRGVREAETGGTWPEQLTIALDYRQWHRFYIERKQDGDWQRLTKRTHGTGSGGEKALALTIPQFAAAAAYYGSAGKHAPRLILLDEAFVGIDSDMRGKCMGMLNEFDLDFVMTSEREWGCYATMPGLAICQLSARAGIDAVWVSRWVWNGHERVREDYAESEISLPPASAGNGRGGDPAPTDGADRLFQDSSASTV